jgi:hypothetical protein
MTCNHPTKSLVPEDPRRRNAEYTTSGSVARRIANVSEVGVVWLSNAVQSNLSTSSNEHRRLQPEIRLNKIIEWN